MTYFPDDGLSETLEKIAPQVKQIIVVDNGSPPERLRAVVSLEAEGKLALIANRRNEGIAAALNQGLGHARAEGFRWSVTFDQDSVPAYDMVPQLVATMERYPGEDEVAMVAANPVLSHLPEGRNSWNWPRPNRRIPFLFERVASSDTDTDGVTLAITSGTLMNLDAFHRLGSFREDFFIDYVDTEYSLRARAAGYRILVSANATLRHNLGRMREVAIGGQRVRPRFHDPARVYYLYRNRIPTLRRYGLAFPHWLLFDITTTTYNLLRILLFEDRRAEKLLASAQGTWDGLRGRMGPR